MVCVNVTVTGTARFLPVRMCFQDSSVKVGNGNYHSLFAVNVTALYRVRRQLFTPINFVPRVEIFLYFAVRNGRPLRIANERATADPRECNGVRRIPRVEDGSMQVIFSGAPLMLVYLDLGYFQVGELSPVRNVPGMFNLVDRVHVNAVFNRRRFLVKVIFFGLFRP